MAGERIEKRTISLRRKVAYMVVLLVVSLLLFEGVLRLAGFKPAPDPEVDPVGDASVAYYWISDWKMGFRNRPNGIFRWDIYPERPLSTTDANGFRNGIGWPGEPGWPIVLFVGDSYTFFAEVDDDLTGTSKVAERLLADGYKVRVLNAGVRGYNMIQIYRLFEEIMARYPEIVGVVYANCYNDSFETHIKDLKGPIAYPTAYLNEQGELVVEEVERLLVEEGCDFRNVDRDLYLNFNDRLARYSVLYNLALKGWRRIQPYREPGSGRIPPSDYVINLENNAARSEGWPVVDYLTKKMAQECESRGAFFLTTYVGNGAEAFEEESARRFMQLCEKEKIDFVPFLPHMAHDRFSYHIYQKNGMRDMHFNAKGAEMFGRVLAPEIAKRLDRSEAYKHLIEKNGE